MRSLIACAMLALVAGCSKLGSEAAADKTVPPAAAVSVNPTWVYEAKKDAMRGSAHFNAMLKSSNAPQLAFPHEGGSPAYISINQTGDEGPFDEGAYFILTNGQMDCAEKCYFAGKFDDGPVFKLTGSQGSCGENPCSILFIDNSIDDLAAGKPRREFARELLKAKKLTLEAYLYKSGAFQYQFDVANLIWPQPGAPQGKSQ